MPRRPSAARRWLIALTWPSGIAITSWDYMWRTTPMHRREAAAPDGPAHRPPRYPVGVSNDEVLEEESGHGPLFHRSYTAHIREAALSPEQLMSLVQSDLNRAAPTTFARFQKVAGEQGSMAVGDEYVVRMPGPWDGPVRVVAVGARMFRLATLRGHLEAGQIEFRVRAEGTMVFEIESWARSSGSVSNLLYHQLRMAKEVQLHMWISFLERVVRLAGGRMTGGVDIDTRRVEASGTADAGLTGSPRVRRRLALMTRRGLNFDPARLPPTDAAGLGWTVEDLCQELPDEPPGPPLAGSSWEIARRLMRGYEFADPSIVRAFYDPAAPLQGRTMLLRLQALGLVRVYVGVRVGEVYEQAREIGNRPVIVWGWNYRTLEGHVEEGEMAWEVWKWLDSGVVEFRVRAVSRPAPIPNPFVRLGFHLLRTHERRVFLDSTRQRMRTFTELGMQHHHDSSEIRRAGRKMTARPALGADPVHDQLARSLGDSGHHGS